MNRSNWNVHKYNIFHLGMPHMHSIHVSSIDNRRETRKKVSKEKKNGMRSTIFNSTQLHRIFVLVSCYLFTTSTLRFWSCLRSKNRNIFFLPIFRCFTFVHTNSLLDVYVCVCVCIMAERVKWYIARCVVLCSSTKEV